MKTPKFMNASFEESLNLEDDKFIDYMEKDTNSRKIYTGENKIGFILLSTFVLAINFMLPFLTKYFLEGSSEDLTVPIPKVNLLPMSLFLSFFLLWTIFWALTKYKNYRLIDKYRRMLNCNNFVVWLLINTNLFFLTMFLIPLTIYGVLLLAILVVFAGYLLFSSRLKLLNKQLFDIEKKETKIDQFNQKVIDLVFKYGWILVIIVVVWKFIFPSSGEVRTDVFGFISVVAMWIGMDILFLAAEAYLFLPYLLYGYYKAKYPEEYREWEGKTQLEWYGKRYFNKYIKGTEKEVREC